jgi:CRP/FNR family transcriptional regulator, cyclic AMP receptor protein
VTAQARVDMFGACMASADDLAQIELFESLEESDLQSLAPWFSERTAGEGVRLCGEGASGYSFFVLKEGRATVTAEGRTLADLGPGDYFGEIAMLDGRRRSASVTPTAPAKLLVMFGSEFRQLQQAQPQIADRIEETMRGRLASDGSA